METETLPIDRINEAFEELETQKTLITNCFLVWKNLSDNYSSLERALADRSQSLDSKLESLESETKKTLESLEQHQSSIPQRESSAAALIEDRRTAVIAEIENPKSRPPRNLNDILRWYCRRMDSPGLWRFMVAHRKELEVFRLEILEAVAETVDPLRLVLEVVEDFTSNPSAAAVSCGRERFWAVGVLVKALFDLVEKKAVEVSGSISDRAAVVVKNWRTMYVCKKGGGEVEEEGKGDVDKGGMEGAESRIFLRMVILFGLRSRFDEDFLLKLVIENAARKEMANHATRLGFEEKIEELIELVKSGKEIDAIYFAHESGLLDKFSPASLLKSYLQNSRKNANLMLKRSKSAASVEESNNFEMEALKSIVKCVETLNLEQKFTIDTLKSRVVDLENEISDRKTKKQESEEPKTKRSKPGTGASNSRSSKSFRSSKHRNPRKIARIRPPPPPPPPRQTYNYRAPVGFAAYPPAAHRSPSVPQYYPHDVFSGARNSMPYIAGGPQYDYNAPPSHSPYQP